MRRLSIKQKQIIINYVKQNYITPAIKNEILSKIEKVNDYETLHQDMERFINDYIYSLDGDRYILNWKEWN